MLLEDLMSREELFTKYKDAIEIYFLWSFYCETLIFSKKHCALLPLEYFQEMQRICRRAFPDWRNNNYMVREGNKVWPVLETIDKEISSQAELNALVSEAYELLG